MPDQLTAVTHDLKCVKCSHVLRGLAINGQCKECGTLVITSLVETLDMPSQQLARVRFPQRVAWGLGTLAIGFIIWSVGTTAPAAGRAITNLLSNSTPAAGSGADTVAAAVSLTGVAIATAGAIQLARRDDRALASETRNAGRWLVAGLGVWLAAAALLLLCLWASLAPSLGVTQAGITFSALGVELVGGTTAAVGLRRFALVLGRRCRRYRQAAQARQSIETLLLAGAISLVFAVASEVLMGMRYGWVEPQTLSLVAKVISWLSGGLFLMGTIYLALNFWWISRIILRPPPMIESVVRVVRPVAGGESVN